MVIVQINPLGCDRVPTTATEIMNRVNEISFNSSLMREMRAISFVTDLIDQGKLDNNSYKRVNVHWIEAERHMRGSACRASSMPAGIPPPSQGNRSAGGRRVARRQFRCHRAAVDHRHQGKFL